MDSITLTWYRAIPGGWFFSWLLLVLTFSLTLPRIPISWQPINRWKPSLVAQWATFSVGAVMGIHAIWVSQDIGFMGVAFLKWFAPWLSETSSIIYSRWQPMGVALTKVQFWALVTTLTVVTPMLTWRMFKIYGLESAIFVIPLLPIFYYLRSANGAKSLEMEGVVTHLIYSRYLIYYAPIVLIFVASLWPQRNRILRVGIWLFVLVLSSIHLNTLETRLAKTALSETTNYINPLIAFSVNFLPLEDHAEVRVLAKDLYHNMGSDRFLEFLQLPDSFAEEAFQFQANTRNQNRFRVVQDNADITLCGAAWCDRHGKAILGNNTALIESLVLARGESAEAFLSHLGLANWSEYVRTSVRHAWTFQYLLK